MECNSVVNGTEKITSRIDFPCCVLIEAEGIYWSFSFIAYLDKFDHKRFSFVEKGNV